MNHLEISPNIRDLYDTFLFFIIIYFWTLITPILQGYGHYFCQQHMCTEPLEEMMGKLLEVNPLAAVQLLESKGLFLASMDLINELI